MSSTRSMFMIIAFLSVAISTVDAYDPDPLQDFCVAVNDSTAGAFVNGRFCKDPKTVTPDDFFFSGLNKPAGVIRSPFGIAVTSVFVDQLPGLNTLGVSIARIEYVPKGVEPPHFQPHASEILHVLQGTLYAGFVSSNPSNPNDRNKVYAKILHPGDVFCIPKGLVHFQYNLGDTNAVAIATVSSQNPEVVTVPSAVFGSEPPVLTDLLVTSFQLNKTEVERLQSIDWNALLRNIVFPNFASKRRRSCDLISVPNQASNDSVLMP